MADVFSPEKRSEVMSSIRGRDTKPELALRSMLHRLGYRFTVNGPKNQSLLGKPDVVLPASKPNTAMPRAASPAAPQATLARRVHSLVLTAMHRAA